MSLGRLLLISVALWAFASTTDASVYTTDFLDHFSGNTYLSGAATLDQIELRLDDPGAAGDNRKTYGNSGIGSFGNAVGGEFRVEAYAPGNSTYNTYSYNPSGQPAATWVFKTFCVEVGQTFSPNAPYYISIDPYALSGANNNSTATGSDGTGLPAGTKYDLLSEATKLLYGLYFEGKLNTEFVGFTYADNSSAKVLQETIWALEDTPSGSLSSGAAALKSWAVTRAGLDHTYANSVAVMNLWTGYDSRSGHFFGDGQSQLVYIPQATPHNNPVPAPGAMVTWSVLMASCLLYGRGRSMTAKLSALRRC